MLPKTFFLTAICCLAALQARAQPKPGAPAPAFSVEKILPERPAGPRAPFQGKAVVLEFWATWCAPCVEQIPHLNSLVGKFAKSDVQFVSITDEEEATVAKFLERRPIAGWIALNPSRSMFKAYGIEGIPVSVLIGRDGTIAAVTTPVSLTERAIEDLLAGKRPQVPALVGRNVVSIRREVSPGGPAPLLDILVRPSQSAGGNSMRVSNERIEVTGFTVKAAVASARQMPKTRIVAPPWANEARYDILAACSAKDSTRLRALFQTAVEAAFGIQVRREPREQDVLVASAPGGRSSNLRAPITSGSSTRQGNGKLITINSPLATVTLLIEELLQKPVIDETGLKERYDYELNWDPSRPESIIEAAREQLGLQLTPARRPVEMLVIEGAYK